MELKEEHSYSVNSGCLTGNSDTKWNEFDHVIQSFMKEHDIPGASIAICRSKEILYKQGYGSAGGSKRVEPDSFFRIASISKPVTAFAILHLCLGHDVNLDSKVFGKKGILKTYKYKDKRVSSITIRHLLQHSAGWDRDIAGDVAFVRPASVAHYDPESVEYNQALLSYVLKKKLQFKPGTRHAYSNFGYLALGLVIEKISGVSFKTYLSEVLGKWGISGIQLGSPWRADWNSVEVEYFNNREPTISPSLHKDFGEVLPQYGGLAMGSAAAFGGLVSNGVNLLHFINVIENLDNENHEDDNRNDDISDVVVTLSDLVKESLRRPAYESGYDWYGLGWDVQDKGKSWGHSGAMEGTSCVLFRHESGLSWVLLLNAWASDIDLNGVVKCAISLMPNLNLFDCDTRLSREIEGFKETECENKIKCNELENGRLLYSKDKCQIIVLGVEETAAYAVTVSLRVKGYFPVWINTFQNYLHFLFGGLCDSKSQPSPSKLTYIIVFSLKDEGLGDFVLFLNKSEDNLIPLIKEKEKEGFIVNFIDSFCDINGNIRFSAVLIEADKCLKNDCERTLELNITGSIYAYYLKSWQKSHNVLCQSVTEIGKELYISSLLEKRKITSESNAVKSIILYWVQIKPESFITELSRKIEQRMNLTYAKFFNSKGEPWVSACWTSGHASNIYHRSSMSKYALFPELAEAAAKNIRLLSVSEYEEEGTVYYAGLWYANQ